MVVRFCIPVFAVAILAVTTTGQEVAVPQSASIKDVGAGKAKKVVWRRAHAHNDYLHKRPLLDAVDHGFCSVEADVFLVDGELLVAHSRFELKKERTLKALYLDPLRKLIKQNGGSVHGDGTPFTLLIDFKADGEATYKALDTLLAQYPDLFSFLRQSGFGKFEPVVAIVSGDRPFQAIKSDRTCFVGIDGRLSDLNDRSGVWMPLISDNWGKHFSWRGEGEFPEAEKEKLRDIVQQAHLCLPYRRVRFWATPDVEAVWKVLDEAGVDLINTDDLPGLSAYFQQSAKQ